MTIRTLQITETEDFDTQVPVGFVTYNDETGDLSGTTAIAEKLLTSMGNARADLSKAELFESLIGSNGYVTFTEMENK